MTALAAVLSGLLGLVAGLLVSRAAARFPGTPGADATPAATGLAVPAPLLVAGTAGLFILTALQFGASWELPAFLWFAGVAVLLAAIDLQHRLLPNRIVVPAIAVGAVLLLVAAAVGEEWPALLRAVLGAVVLFVSFLILALISPRGLGMGDVKLAGLVGLYLGWLGWSVLVLGAAAGFVVQAVLALILLAGRRIGLRGELPFGPAMLLGAALAIGWSRVLLG